MPPIDRPTYTGFSMFNRSVSAIRSFTICEMLEPVAVFSESTIATEIDRDAAIGRGAGGQIFREDVAGGHYAMDVDHRVAGPCFKNTQRHAIQ